MSGLFNFQKKTLSPLQIRSLYCWPLTGPHQSLYRWRPRAPRCAWSSSRFPSRAPSSLSSNCPAANSGELTQPASCRSACWSLPGHDGARLWGLFSCLDTSWSTHFRVSPSHCEGSGLLFCEYSGSREAIGMFQSSLKVCLWGGPCFLSLASG